MKNCIKKYTGMLQYIFYKPSLAQNKWFFNPFNIKTNLLNWKNTNYSFS